LKKSKKERRKYENGTEEGEDEGDDIPGESIAAVHPTFEP